MTSRPADDGFPPYPSGLRLAGRRVVVAGGGHVAQRRVPGLLGVGADVVVVSPQVTPAVEGFAVDGFHPGPGVHEHLALKALAALG